MHGETKYLQLSTQQWVKLQTFRRHVTCRCIAENSSPLQSHGEGFLSSTALAIENMCLGSSHREVLVV